MQIVPVTMTGAVDVEVFTTEEEQALVGFLAGYGGLTFEAYQPDFRQWVQWCAERQVALFGARRADIEGFGRHLEACGRARATVARRLCTIACFYRYAEEEGLIPTSPAVHVRRPRARLRIACDRLGPQRGRSDAGVRRTRRRLGARVDQLARAERPPGF